MVTIKEATEKRSKKAGQNNEKTWKQVEEENSKGRGKNGGQGVIQALKGIEIQDREEITKKEEAENENPAQVVLREPDG